MDFDSVATPFSLEEQREKDRKLQSSLDQYGVIVFPSTNTDHYENTIPFYVCEDNIFNRPLKRHVDKHSKQGISEKWTDLEQCKNCSHDHDHDHHHHHEADHSIINKNSTKHKLE